MRACMYVCVSVYLYICISAYIYVVYVVYVVYVYVYIYIHSTNSILYTYVNYMYACSVTERNVT